MQLIAKGDTIGLPPLKKKLTKFYNVIQILVKWRKKKTHWKKFPLLAVTSLDARDIPEVCLSFPYVGWFELNETHLENSKRDLKFSCQILGEKT